MNNDIYTKAILTVIAGCLRYFPVEDVVTDPKPVYVSLGGTSLKVDLARIGGNSFQPGDHLSYTTSSPPPIPLRIVR